MSKVLWKLRSDLNLVKFIKEIKSNPFGKTNIY